VLNSHVQKLDFGFGDVLFLRSYSTPMRFGSKIGAVRVQASKSSRRGSGKVKGSSLAKPSIFELKIHYLFSVSFK
jgi:hypothetical protein